MRRVVPEHPSGSDDSDRSTTIRSESTAQARSAPVVAIAASSAALALTVPLVSFLVVASMK